MRSDEIAVLDHFVQFAYILLLIFYVTSYEIMECTSRVWISERTNEKILEKVT